MQTLIIRFFHEHEVPVVAWSDNGGQFKNVIEAAIENALGVKARHIPPGRPQANGLVEVFNRIMDSAMGGERNRLMSAVVAHNSKPTRLIPSFGRNARPHNSVVWVKKSNTLESQTFLD